MAREVTAHGHLLLRSLGCSEEGLSMCSLTHLETRSRGLEFNL